MLCPGSNRRHLKILGVDANSHIKKCTLRPGDLINVRPEREYKAKIVDSWQRKHVVRMLGIVHGIIN